MTEYKAYQEAVERGLEGLEFVSTGACPGCDECGLGPVDCEHCDGTGGKDGDKESPVDCPHCQGEGAIGVDEDDYGAIEAASEPSFSWCSCDCCGSDLGGERHPAHASDKNGALIHFNVCTDCLYYINYGQLDDTTMDEMEEAE